MDDPLYRQLVVGADEDSDDNVANTSDDSEHNQNVEDHQEFEEVTKKHGNTGPKGVLSDYEDYKLWKREQKILENIETWERLKGGAASLRSENPNAEDEEKTFIESYREKRLKELRKNEQEALLKRKRFGHLLKICDEIEFLDCVENAETRDQTIIVHISDDGIEACQLMNEALAELAEKHLFVQFLAVHPDDIQSDFDSDVLPSLLVYRNGDLVESLIKVCHRNPGGTIGFEQVESLLIAKGIL